MSNNRELNCALALMAASEKYSGRSLDDQVVMDSIQGEHSKAVYVAATNRWLDKALNLDYNRNLFSDTVNYLADGSHIIGEGNVAAIDELFRDFLTKHKVNGAGEAAFKRDYAPTIKKLRDALLDDPNVPLLKKPLIEAYFDKQINGGSLFGQKNAVGPLGQLAQNAVGNLVSWNPMITMMNAFEFTPKASAYALAKGRPDAILKGLATYMEKTGAQFWKRVPELEQLGVYGTRDHLGKGFNLIDATENPLRGISYYIGEAIQPGLGSEALEKIAFVHRYGNEPMVFLDHQGTLSFTLMRYSLSATKFYLNLLKGVKSGDPKAVSAFLAFSAITAAQTGGRSAVPLPVDAGLEKAFGDDYKDAMQAFDDAAGLNFSKRYLGTDLTKYAQPVGGVALGAGYNIATQDVAGGFRAIGKGIENVSDGNYTAAATNFLQSAMGFGQLGRMPGVNLLSKRAVDALAEVAAGEAEADDYLQVLGEKTHVLNQPEE